MNNKKEEFSLTKWFRDKYIAESEKKDTNEALEKIYQVLKEEKCLNTKIQSSSEFINLVKSKLK